MASTRLSYLVLASLLGSAAPAAVALEVSGKRDIFKNVRVLSNAVYARGR